MAVFKKTYYSPFGDSMFVDPGLALGTIYSFSVNGEYDYTEVPWDEFNYPASGQFMYHRPTGTIKVSPDYPFLPGFITIIYKAIGIPIPPPPEPPMVCEEPTVVASLSAPNVIRFQFGGAGNYKIQVIPGAAFCGSTPLIDGTVNGGDSFLYGPVPNGSYKACVQRDCGGGMLSGQVTSNTVTVAIPPQNFGARKDPPDTEIKILSVTGVPYTIRSGAFPLVTGGQEMRGRHEGFTANIVVKLQVKKKQQVVVALYKNGPLVQFIPVYQANAGVATVVFNLITATAADDIFVLLGYS